MSANRRQVVADTSFLINLFATRIASELLDHQRLLLIVPTRVHEEVKRNRADLDSLVAQGRARIVELPLEALPHYVQAAAAVDDGEAAAIALSICMRVSIATDDGCAACYWSETMATDKCQVFGICELLQAMEAELDQKRVRDALVGVRRDANFAPPRHHAAWWHGVLNGGSQAGLNDGGA